MTDISGLDFNLLKALDALLDERNVTRAANRLSVTQPAMSGMLTRLRDAFGDPLFVRAQRGIVPTDRALELRLPVKRLMSEIGSLLQPPTFDPMTADQTFTLAATDYAQRTIAVPFLTTLKQRAPRIRVSLIGVEHTVMQGHLERGEIDLALLTPEMTPPDLHARRLFDERYVCVVREGHPIARGDRLTMKQFCDLDHALVSYSGNPFHGVTDDALEKLGKHRQVSLSVQCFLVLPEILMASDMIAVLPSRLVKGMAGLRVFEPPFVIEGFTKVAAWHERTHRDVAHRWLRELLFEVCGDGVSPPS
ncbi:LysR family transcriptional regulator [Acerihabitans sp. KWT182]|uniref:LysR family transcriptional regulator n=1 Tax=Acerihabitans sp. KWT182 TaxID=3157919 RepID=A0AAU7QG05_9GAMM